VKHGQKFDNKHIYTIHSSSIINETHGNDVDIWCFNPANTAQTESGFLLHKLQ